MIIVLDKILYPETIKNIDYDVNPTYFEPKDEHPNKEICERLIKTASNYIDLTRQVGYDTWFHKNSSPDWHVDRDEKHFFRTGQNYFPLCSIVYYPEVKELEGGELIFKNNMRIKPVSNRLVIFGPALEHKVTSIINGKRTSMNINVWSYPNEVATYFN